jgi:hypothetical protein
MWTEVHKPEQLIPKLEIIDANINFLREHPIGWLRQMIPMIDKAFSTCQRIMRAYEDMLDRFATPIPLDALMTIRDDDEATIQLAGAISIAAIDASTQPVDWERFRKYLGMQSDVQCGSPQYRLVQKSNKVLQDLDEAVSFAVTRILTSAEAQSRNPSRYSIQVSGGRELHVNVKFQDNDGLRPEVPRFHYKLYPVTSVYHLGLSAVATISSHLDLLDVWQCKTGQYLVLAKGDPDGRYFWTWLYLVDPGNVQLLTQAPLYAFPEPIRVYASVFSQRKSQLGISGESLESKFLLVFDIDLARREVTPHRERSGLTIGAALTYGPGDELYFANIEEGKGSIYTYSSATEAGESERPLTAEIDIDEDGSLTLIGTSSYLVAIRSGTGEIRTIIPEGDDIFSHPIDPTRLAAKCSIFTSSTEQQYGLVVYLPFRPDQDRIKPEFHPQRDSGTQFFAKLGAGLGSSAPLPCQLGFPEPGADPSAEPNRQQWNVHLTIAE